jgi:hypothetical protein
MPAATPSRAQPWTAALTASVAFALDGRSEGKNIIKQKEYV